MRLFTKIFSVVFLFVISHQSYAANNAIYEQRRLDYVDSCLASGGGARIVLQAYKGVPVDANLLNAKLASIVTGNTSDFDIIELVRILYLDSGTYDAQILPVLNSVPYWVNNRDTVRNYWSENHMIMWMGSDWLLHERYGKVIDNTLDARLRHYLNLKIQYGFYEFFSSVYTPYCLSGLLNLADFAQDAQIKDLATQASQKLLDELLMLTNDKGVFFPVAGRNYPSKYETPYGQSHNNLIYLLTGFGQAPTGASAGGAFLASSTLPVDSVIYSWTPTLDTLYHIGHTLDSGFIINSAMSSVDKTVFQWSSGAYFHPDVVSQTVQLLIDSNLWDQVDFALLAPLRPIINPGNAQGLSESLGVISKSSVICGQDVAIFKHNSVTLASVIDFWKGKVGFQQHPCVANVGTTAVYTGSGEVKVNWQDRNDNSANVHLPYVQQKKNVALLMYRPEPTPSIIGTSYTFKEVALHWKDADFDEVVNDSVWLLGRQAASYVAVRRSCIGEINTVRACATNGGQTWVIMVGDSAMYGSFTNFQSIVHQSQFEERWYMDTASSQYVYYSKIVIDSTSIDYAWGVDSLVSGIENITATKRLGIFPNPSNDKVTLDLSAFVNQPVSIKVMNPMGVEVYAEKIESVSTQPKSLFIEKWAAGIYLVTIQNQQTIFSGKLIKSE
ncbi:MAG: T9SS type A sorting domain-containing protein [Bacteroidota bacterium]